MISRWATDFNVTIKKCEERPDRPTGDVIYRVVDLFTTHNGSWEPGDALGAVPQWARAKYLRPLGATDYFDDAGGDHHIFAKVLDLDGKPILRDNLIRLWSDGFDKLGDPAYRGYVTMTPKRISGWANQPLFNSFSPERGERGAWCWCPEGASDVVAGGGLPNNQHISFFAVWQAEPVTTPQHPRPPVERDESAPAALRLESLRRRAWEQLNVRFTRESVFANYARVHNLGAPLTNEYDLSGYRAQGFAQGIVYAPRDDQSKTSHMSW